MSIINQHVSTVFEYRYSFYQHCVSLTKFRPLLTIMYSIEDVRKFWRGEKNRRNLHLVPIKVFSQLMAMGRES